jgi:hypothetical protein
MTRITEDQQFNIMKTNLQTTGQISGLSGNSHDLQQLVKVMHTEELNVFQNASYIQQKEKQKKTRDLIRGISNQYLESHEKTMGNSVSFDLLMRRGPTRFIFKIV